MTTTATLVRVCSALLFILAIALGKPILAVVALAFEVGYAALSGKPGN
ncbi:hypothetical protein [Roseateles depolymerans]|nr:hypothetical protein [Roseateles depolymerans]